MTMMNLDIRIWNIVAGLGVVVGCNKPLSSRVDTNGEIGDGENTSTSTSDSVDTQETPPECVTSDDCPPEYECLHGICYDYGPSDGAMPYPCADDVECGP